MIGAIAGDIVGSPYEFDCNNYKGKDFPLFSEKSIFTDDTVMTLAIARALRDGAGDEKKTAAAAVELMRQFGNNYPGRGYGGRFFQWLVSKKPEPYGSFGNGSAMRVSSVGWFCDTLEETEHWSDVVTAVTHDHPEGLKGARATAVSIFLARTGHSKDEIRKTIEERYGYDLSRTADEIRPGYTMSETCQESVPEAIICFLEGKDFEDVLRTAVSIGGDSDTIAAIAGSIAEAFYGVPDEIRAQAEKRLDAFGLWMLHIIESSPCFKKAK